MDLQELKQIADNLRALTPERMRDITLQAIQDNKQTAINMNTDQLFAGELVTGKKLPNYSPVSVEKFGKRPGPWTLYDEGDYYGGWYMDAITFPIIFGTKDRKAGIIAEKLAAKGINPDDVFSLNKKNLKDFGRNYVLDTIRKTIRPALHLR